MFVVIVGCNSTGYHLAKLLLVAQHEVVVLENSLARCQRLWDELGSVVIHGDGTDLVTCEGRALPERIPWLQLPIRMRLTW